jgi:hypothetical protein
MRKLARRHGDQKQQRHRVTFSIQSLVQSLIGSRPFASGSKVSTGGGWRCDFSSQPSGVHRRFHLFLCCWLLPLRALLRS